MPKTNGVIENKVKLVLHGARVLLRQAGFEPRWWPFAVRHFSMARNIENRGDGSPWTRRHGDGNFSGVILPFGCLVDFYPMSPKTCRDRKGGFKTPKTTSDTLGRLTQKTLMKEDTTGSQMKTRKVEETSVTTALPAEKKEWDFIKIEEDPKFAPSSKPGLFLGYRLEPEAMEGRLSCC